MKGALVETLRMIKIEHSIFALPFALVSAFWAASGVPPARLLLLIIVAMVTARSAAMAFNRYLDADIDAKNPRTAVRSIPAGRLSKSFALGFTLVSSAAFVLVCGWINQLTLIMSPIFLLVLLGYSWAKRFTSLCHLILGLALGLAPLGAWVAITGAVHLAPVLLGLAVMVWTAGFDVIYACQDFAFDREHGLFSIPAKLGIQKALILSRFLHLLALGLLVYLGIYMHQGIFYWIGTGIVSVLLVYEHRLVWGGDLTKVDMAFFTLNGMVSLFFGVLTILGVLLAPALNGG